MNVRMVGFLFLFVCLPVVSFTETREEQWTRLRQEKSRVLVPGKLSRSESVLYRIERQGFNLSYKGFYPTVASVTTGAGFGGQLRYLKQHFPLYGFDLQVLGAYTTRRYQVYNLQFGKIMSKGIEPLMASGGTGGFSDFHGLGKRKPQDFYLYTDLRYTYFPQEDYFGSGPDSSKDNHTNYLIESSSAALVAAYRLNRFALIAGTIGYLHHDLRSGTDSRFPSTEEVFDDEEAPGLLSQPDFLSFRGGLIFDYRDKPGNPHSGGMIGAQFTRYNDRGGENFEFSRYTFDARHYLLLGSPQRILAARFLTSFEEPDGDARVPFYLQESLGGGEILRGYDYNRFRDRNMLYLSGEYRWEAAPGWEFALFYDTGKVFSSSSDFNFNDLNDSYGFGVRFKLPQSMFMRIDTAWSKEGTHVYIKFGLASF